MQKKLLVGAVLSAIAGAASAQSSNVTIYGTINQPFEFMSVSGSDSSASGAAGQNSSTRVQQTVAAGALVAQPATNVGLIRLGPAAGNATNPTGAADQATRTRFQNAGSNFGLRGTEDLGNGLSAWFQLEMSIGNIGAAPPNFAQNHGTAPTFRNTAVGLRSNTWGTLLTGAWDSPFNQIAGSTNANNRTGHASTNLNANLLGATTFGYGSVSGQTLTSWCSAAGAGGGGAAACFNYGSNFDRRERAAVQWWSPNWNGFEVKAQYNATADNGGQTASNLVGGASSLRPVIWNLTAGYSNGPLHVIYGYERNKDTLALSARTFAGGFSAGEGTGAWTIGGTPAGGAVGASYASGSTNIGHRLGGRYAFDLGGGSSIGLGALWESLKWDIDYGQTAGVAAVANNLTQLKKTAYRLQANFTTGNHFVGFEYTKANELKGNITRVGGGVGNSFDGSGSSAKGYVISYNYAMSKRTSVGAYWTQINNDTNANYSGIVFGGATTAAGGDPRYYGLHLRHAF